MLSREDYRKIKAMSKEEMSRWLQIEHNLTHNRLRRQFEEVYKDELDNSVCNFLIAIWYTLHFNEDIALENDALNSFMEDLFVSVDLFRKGEYKPEDYVEQLKEDGIKFAEYDYSKLYRDRIKVLDECIKEKKQEILDNENITRDDMVRIIAEIEAINNYSLYHT